MATKGLILAGLALPPVEGTIQTVVCAVGAVVGATLADRYVYKDRVMRIAARDGLSPEIVKYQGSIQDLIGVWRQLSYEKIQ